MAASEVPAGRLGPTSRDRPVVPPADARAPGEVVPHATRRRQLFALALVLAIAFVVRLQPWDEVFRAGRPGAALLGDTDPYYHALRAERIAERFPHVPWHDEGMNYPLGADILWPPLFDQLIASGAVVAGGGAASRADIERVAAWLPVIIGVATVGLLAAFGPVLFGDGPWLGAALLLALLPAHVEFTVLGRADQHAAELLLQTAAMLAFAALWGADPTRGRRRAGLAMGLALALSFWNWQGSALYLLLMAACTAAWHIRDEGGESAACVAWGLASGAGTGAVLLAGSLLAWGKPGALFDTSLMGVNGVQVLLTALVALFSLGLWGVSRLRRGRAPLHRRAAEVALVAAVLLTAAAATLPGLRTGVGQGLIALTAGNPWYASIREFQPLLFGGAGIGHELAAWIPRFSLLFVMPLAARALMRRWCERPDQRAAVTFLLAWGTLLLVATLARKRFVLYLSVPAVLWAWVALSDAARRWSRRTRRRHAELAWLAGGLAVLMAPAAFYFSHGGLQRDPTQVEVVAALEWLRQSTTPDPARPAVFSEWDWGHLVQYFSGRPAVATPFGSDGGTGALADAADFFLATVPASAERVLERRRVSYVLMTDPLTQAAESVGLSPGAASSPVTIEWHWLRGPRVVVTPAVDDLVAARLYFDNGLSSRRLATLDRYRLVYEGPPTAPRQVRLFEFVPGASLLVEAAPPGTLVRVETSLHTNRGRRAPWRAVALTDEQGRAVLRVPYATGMNGVVMAAPYVVTGEGAAVRVDVAPAAVAGGQRVRVVLRPGP